MKLECEPAVVVMANLSTSEAEAEKSQVQRQNGLS